MNIRLEDVSLRDIRPNPFRDVERYPLLPQKLEALEESIRQTEVWPNIEVRRTEHGTFEQAYGHHRVEAARRCLGEDGRIPVIVRDLSDREMLRRMARENAEEWGAPATAEQETVRGAVEAYAAGRIELPPVPEKAPHDRLRSAPSFVSGNLEAGPERRYTAESVGEFLNWDVTKVRDQLQALELIETGVLPDEVYRDLRPTAARALTLQVRKRIDEAKKRAADARAEAERVRSLVEAAEDPEDRAEKERIALDREEHAEELEQEIAEAVAKASTLGKELAERLRTGDPASRADDLAEEIESGPRGGGRNGDKDDKNDDKPIQVERWAQQLGPLVEAFLNPHADGEEQRDAALKLHQVLVDRAALSEESVTRLRLGLQGVRDRTDGYLRRCNGEQEIPTADMIRFHHV